jgi:hypothetical protein
MPKKSAIIREVRSEYEQIKRLYKKIGKKTFGTSAKSPIRKDYRAVKRAYGQIGRKLGKLTGRKSR